MRYSEGMGRERLDRLARAESRLRPVHFTRGHRRRVVSVAAVLAALLWANVPVVYLLAPSTTAMTITFVLWAVVIAGCLLAYYRLVPATHGAVGLPDALLDEWQRAERLHARSLAHRATLVLIFVGYFVVMLASPDGDTLSAFPSAVLPMPFVALIVTVGLLPSLILAWRLPDPPPEEDG